MKGALSKSWCEVGSELPAMYDEMKSVFLLSEFYPHSVWMIYTSAHRRLFKPVATVNQTSWRDLRSSSVHDQIEFCVLVFVSLPLWFASLPISDMPTAAESVYTTVNRRSPAKLCVDVNMNMSPLLIKFFCV